MPGLENNWVPNARERRFAPKPRKSPSGKTMGVHKPGTPTPPPPPPPTPRGEKGVSKEKVGKKAVRRVQNKNRFKKKWEPPGGQKGMGGVGGVRVSVPETKLGNLLV